MRDAPDDDGGDGAIADNVTAESKLDYYDTSDENEIVNDESDDEVVSDNSSDEASATNSKRQRHDDSN